MLDYLFSFAVSIPCMLTVLLAFPIAVALALCLGASSGSGRRRK